jgi:hypothetical protein
MRDHDTMQHTPDGTNVWPRRRRRAVKAALGCIVILAMAEFTIGIFTPSFYNQSIRNPDIGAYTYVPNIRAAYRNIESGLLFRLRTNGGGFRDAERPFVNMPGAIDVVVIGNSFVDARQVPLRDRFTMRLERKIADASGKARVFNFGIDGQGIINHFDLANYAESALSPDLVVLFLTVVADFNQSSQTTFRDGRRVTYRVTANGVVRETQTLGRWHRLARQARGWVYRLWLGRITYQTYKQVAAWFSAHAAADESCPLPLRGRSSTFGPSFRLAEAMVTEMHQKLGNRLLVTILPDQQQLRAAGDAKGDAADCNWGRAERWLDELTKRHGVRTVSLLPALKAANRPVFFPEGHLNVLGHERVAEALLGQVRSQRRTSR